VGAAASWESFVGQFRIRSNALAREVDGETVLVNIESGQYFGLDEVGTEIWRRLEQGDPLEDIPAHLTTLFEVEESVARADLEALVSQLVESQLLEPVSE